MNKQEMEDKIKHLDTCIDVLSEKVYRLEKGQHLIIVPDVMGMRLHRAELCYVVEKILRHLGLELKYIQAREEDFELVKKTEDD